MKNKKEFVGYWSTNDNKKMWCEKCHDPIKNEQGYFFETNKLKIVCEKCIEDYNYIFDNEEHHEY